MKLISTLLIILIATIVYPFQSFAQDITFETFNFNASISDTQTLNAEIGSCIDNDNNVHIAWIRDSSEVNTVMYSKFDRVTNQFTHYEVGGDISSDRKFAPYIVTDADNAPHIAYLIKRDISSGTNSGNYAVMYAENLNKDGIFEVSQASTNSTDPNIDENNLFDCYVNGRPNVFFDGDKTIVSYVSDANSSTGYDNWLIYATKSGNSWARTQEFEAESTTLGGNYYVPYGLSTPVNATSEYHFGYIEITDYSPRFIHKTNDSWQNIEITGYRGVYDNSHVQMEIDKSGTIHYFWFNEGDTDKFCHTTLNGSSYSSVIETSIVQTPGGNFFPATIDLTLQTPVYFYDRFNSDFAYFVVLDENGLEKEYEVEDIGNTYGRESLHANDGYIALVRASDNDDKIYLTVSLNELSENQAPEIAGQTFTLDENSVNGTIVGTVYATDSNADAMKFSISSGNESGAFALDSISGVLTVSGVSVLDFETSPSFALTVSVSDYEFTVSATVTVNLNDLNENLLEDAFETFSFDATISDTQTPRAEVGSCIDNENNVHIVWIRDVLEVSTVMYSKFDRETKQFTHYEVDVTVSADRKFSPYIVTDANNAPHITYFIRRDLLNSTSNSGNFAVMYAEDLNKDGVFEIYQASTNSIDPNIDENNLFDCYVNGRPNVFFNGNKTIVSYLSDVNSSNGNESGIIFATKNGNVWDRVQEFDINSTTLGGAYSLSEGLSSPVNAVSGSHLGYIEISNHSPRFIHNTNGTWQNMEVTGYRGSFDNRHVQMELDRSGTVHYFWFNDNNTYKFCHTTLNGSSYSSVKETLITYPTGGDFYPATLDLTLKTSVYFYDRLSSDLSYFVILNEDGVAKEYEVEDIGKIYGRESLHADNGLIALVSASDFDDKIYLTVNWNDLNENKSPEISDQTFALDENSVNGTIVGTLSATDPNADILTYSITSGNELGAFFLDASSGTLAVADVSILDFEAIPSFSLIVEVTDSEFTVSATITVHLNDIIDNQKPIIVDQTFTLDENTTNGSIVGTVSASDFDADVLSYSIISGNELGGFALDGSIGILAVSNVSILDFETNPSFTLTVEVSDSELTDTAIVTVILNDIPENEPPEIVDQTLTLDENSPNGAIVGIVLATDPNTDTLSYLITSGNELGGFALDGSTGILAISDVSILDFETNPSFTLAVEVSDGEFTVSATVIVNLNDVDEEVIASNNELEFELRVYPNPANDRIVISTPSTRPADLITLVNLSGEIIRWVKKSDEMEVLDIADGFYILIVEIGNNRVLEPIIIQRK